MKRRNFLAGLIGFGTGTKTIAANRRTKPIAVALSIGISQYDNGPNLPSATKDAELMAEVFSDLGFESSLLVDADKHSALLALAQLRLRASNAPLVAIYIAAHGLMAGGQAHVLCSDANFSKPFQASLSESILFKAISDQPRQKLFFLDTCRELPSLPAQRRSNTSIRFFHSAGAHVSYASQPGSPAYDGVYVHSPYATALARVLRKPNLTIHEISLAVRLQVLRQTSGQQIPWERSSLLSPLIINPS